MIRRRQLVLALGAIALASSSAAYPQASGKVWRIGFLGRESAAGYSREIEVLRSGLKEFGYVEGKNLVIEYRWAEGVNERLPTLAHELVRQKVDILVTHTYPGVRAALSATATVPIVFTSIRLDPVSTGLVKSLARPGGNITGLSTLTGTMTVKQLELVKDALPRARKVAFMLAATADTEMEDSIQTAAKTLNLDIQLVRISSANALEAAIAAMPERRVDALIVSTQPLLLAHSAKIATLAERQRIPALGSVNFAESGALIGYGSDIASSYRRAAYFIDRIFKGTRPADLPIEQPSNIELVVNLKTAKALGIRIPETVMVRADRVIQ